jgi:hypothetical protein
MIDPEPVPLERLVAQLREAWRQRAELMRNAGNVPTLPETVSSVIDRYDRLLLDTAAMLEVDVPADARSPMDPTLLTHQGRIAQEAGLAAAGVDVRAREV